MGLIKSAIQSISGELKDQWKDYITCEDMDMNTLMVKKTTKTGGRKGSILFFGLLWRN